MNANKKTKYVEYLKHLVFYITLENLSSFYEKTLIGLAQIIKVTLTFFQTLIQALPTINIKSPLSILFSLAVYSKIILLISTVTPFPPVIITFTTEYLNPITSTYGSTVTLITGVFTFFKDNILEYKNTSETVELQNSMLEKIHISHTELLNQIEELRKSSVPQEIFDKERLAWL